MRRITISAGALTVGLAVSFVVATNAYSTSGKWSSTSVPYMINPSNQDVSASAAEAAVQAGANAWEQQSSANFRFSYAGRVNDTTTGFDQRNVVLFRNSENGGTIATTYYWTSNGVLLDADIVFWDGGWTFYTGSSGCSSGAYIEDAATHEFGHALGLKHSSVSDATMYASYSRCSTQLRSLAADDIAGLESLYPPTSGNTAPVVSISAPANQTSVPEGTTLTFAGSASDKEDGNLSSAMAWTSSLEGPLGGGSFTRILSAGTHTITASVSDSRGVTASSHVTVTVTAQANTAPTVTITSPTNNATVSGSVVTFTGNAVDSEDGLLTSNMTWRSSLDGILGMGGSFSKTLSAGSHVIEAAVTDSSSMTVAKKVNITVSAPTTGIWLAASGYKKKGSQYANLQWGGATTSKVDIYVNGSRFATTANSGSYVVSTSTRGGGSSTYRVCEAGTSACSAGVTVNF